MQVGLGEYLSLRGYGDDSAPAAQSIHSTSSRHYFASRIPTSETLLPLRNDTLNLRTHTHAYTRLRLWIHSSLEVYRHELEPLLYPIFVHIYLDLVAHSFLYDASHFLDNFKSDHAERHGTSIQILSSITSPSHLEEDQMARSFRTGKYVIRLSRISYELVVGFLEENGFSGLLRILNQYIEVQVLKKRPRKKSEHVVGVHTGFESGKQLDAFNEQNVKLGPRQISSENPDEARDHKMLVNELERIIKEEDNREQSRLSVPQRKSLLQTYREKELELNEIEIDERPTKTESVPLPPVEAKDLEREISELRDLRERVKLSSSSLPSICCYTLHNTYDTCTSMDVSPEVELMATGFSESIVKVWSLVEGKMLRAMKPVVNPENLNSDMDLGPFKEKHGSYSKKLVGHSGPVFKVAFSPDSKFLLSCSEDSTVRLWSLDTFTNLVVYRGHNYPVWDLDIGPKGVYFATASHDQTARLWSTAHIHPLRIFVGHLADVDCVKFHPNSNYLATGSGDHTCRLWDIQRGECVRVLPGHTGTVFSLAMSPNGRVLASGSHDRSIILWDLRAAKRIRQLSGHQGVVSSLSFSANAELLASGGLDDTVRVWDCCQMSSGGGPDNDAAAGKGLLGTYPTRSTPILTTRFTRRNLLVVGGPANL